jgi:hypothetical protein
MKKSGFRLFVFLLSVMISTTLTAQSNQQDSTKTGERSSYEEHSPKKAAYMSILPGLGQIYNRKYWKVPIIYAGLGTALYFAIDNNKSYVKYRDAYIGRIDEDTSNNNILPEYSTEDLRELKNYHWKYRDMSILIIAAVWALNILDATVDAHLYSFDISDNLSMRIEPRIAKPMAFGSRTTYGFTISLTF